MKTFARLENDVVREILAAEKLPEFHPDLDWRDVTEVLGITEGWLVTESGFEAPRQTRPTWSRIFGWSGRSDHGVSKSTKGSGGN